MHLSHSLAKGLKIINMKYTYVPQYPKSVVLVCFHKLNISYHIFILLHILHHRFSYDIGHNFLSIRSTSIYNSINIGPSICFSEPIT